MADSTDSQQEHEYTKSNGVSEEGTQNNHNLEDARKARQPNESASESQENTGERGSNNKEHTETVLAGTNADHLGTKKDSWISGVDNILMVIACIALILLIILLCWKKIERLVLKKKNRHKQLKDEGESTSSIASSYEVEINRLQNKVRELVETNREQISQLREKSRQIDELENRCILIEQESQIQKDNLEIELAESQEMLAKTKESLWPTSLLQSPELRPLLENIEKEYLDQKTEAQEVHAALSKIAIKDSSDIKAIVREIIPLSQAFYKWLENVSISNVYAETLSSWLTKQLSSEGIIVKAINEGDSYSDSHHSCSSPNGSSITKVQSFLILSCDNEVMKKAQVEVNE